MKSELSWDIIKRFSGNDQDCFSYQDVAMEYPDTNRAQLSKILSGMVEKGMLIKLNRNLYHIVPISADADFYMPDWHLVAKYLMKRKRVFSVEQKMQILREAEKNGMLATTCTCNLTLLKFT